MSTQLKLRRGTTVQHASFTGGEGEVTVDTTKDTVVVHDGSTAGGHPLLKESAIGVTVQGYDSTILKSANIGVTVQGYDATTLKSAAIGVTVQGYDANTVKTASTQTLTNKRITQRVTNNGATTSGTITPAGNTSDQYEILGLTGNITIAAPSGTPTAGQKLVLRIKDNGSNRGITWTTTSGAYRAIGTLLPTSTVAGKVTYVGCIYNATDGYWDVVGVSTQA